MDKELIELQEILNQSYECLKRTYLILDNYEKMKLNKHNNK